MLGRFICIKQYDNTDCAAACLATISKQHGLKISITKIREIAGTDKQGTNAYGIIKAAEQLGFSAKGVKGTKENIFDEFPLPAIAHVITTEGLMHYVVIHKITKKIIIVADPAKGIVKYTHEDFFKIWTGILILIVPTAKFEKGNHNEGTFSRFTALAIHQKSLFINIFFASMILTALGLLSTFFFKILMDEVIPNGLVKTLNIFAIGIIALYLFQTLLDSFRQQLLLYLSQRMDISLILGYYHHVINLPMNFFGTRKVGEIISRFTDASKVHNAISGATLTIMIDSIMVVVGGIILYIQSPFLFGISFVIEIIYTIIVFLFKKPIRDINRIMMEQNSQLTSYLVESLNGIETVKAFSAEGKANLITENKFVKQLRSGFKAGVISNVQSAITGFIASVGGVIILWAGTYSVIEGKMSIGQLLTFNALLAYFIGPLKNLINLQPMLQSAMVAADRLGEILDIELEKSENEKNKIIPLTLKGDIEFKDLDFRYGTRHLVLKNINMKIKQGEKIAFVGESGSGKTTLVKLLLNFYQAEKGEILINEYNVQDINLDKLREKIAYISQDIFLFSGTITENLSLGLEDCSMEEIVDAAKVAKAHDFINELPLRYNTVLQENGTNLSGGQKQRLAIARALLKKPDILIMDEATSNLDSITENAIEKTITTLTEGITTIIIAHRLSTIRKCDKIYVMEKGEFVESGSHNELINMNGVYSRFWGEQTENTEHMSTKEVVPL